jgi:hypothetical protein
MADDYYTGPVCYRDGWHWTVVTDAGDKARRVELAEVALKHAQKNGDAGRIAAAQSELDEVQAHPHDATGQRLHLEDTADGSQFRYRLATDADVRSWHDRRHGQFAHIQLEGGAGGMTVTADELGAITEFLAGRREGK